MGRSLTSDTYRFTYHGYGVTHIDALCHFAYNGRLYNDVPLSANTSEGCGRIGIENLKNGIVTRGILLDFPRLKGVPYLEPGTPIYIEDIEAWEPSTTSPSPCGTSENESRARWRWRREGDCLTCAGIDTSESRDRGTQYPAQLQSRFAFLQFSVIHA